MGRCMDEAKRRVWRQRLARFARSGQKVAGFCAAEGVSVPTLYQWNRELASESVGRRSGVTRSQAGASVAGSPDQAFLPVRIQCPGPPSLAPETPSHNLSGDLRLSHPANAAAGRPL